MFMKKIFLLLSLFVTISLSAQNYKSSVGLVVGSYNGFSYKTFVSENVALQADLGFGLLATQGSVGVVGYEGLIYGVEKHWSFYANPNLYCQKEFYNTDWGGISAFIGGGLSLGLASEFSSSVVLGKWGINAIAGIEFGLDDEPFTFGLDFRPGYEMIFGHGLYGNFFYLALASSVRYIF